MMKKYITGPGESSSGLLMRLQKLTLMLLFLFFGVSNVSGQVTVSGALTGNATYSNLGAAFTAIGASSQAGANISIVISADVSEGNTTAILGAGDWNSLIITPSGGAWTILGSNTAEMIRFDGADNVTINGLNSGGNSLTISNASATNAAGTSTIKFVNDATNNTITNCTLLGSGTSIQSTANAGGVVYFGNGITTGNDGNTISFCNIGPAGANLPTKLIYGSGLNTNESTCNSGITITGCNLYDFFIANNNCTGIYATLGNTAWNITNNKIYQTGSRLFTNPGSMYGIFFSNTNYGNNVQITGNIIGFADSAGTGTTTINTNASVAGGFQGIYLLASSTAATACNISNNTIANVSLASTGSGTVYGINNATGASANTINITGNTVKDISTVGNAGTFAGIYAGSAATLNCNNNRIENLSKSGIGVFYGINYTSCTNATFDSNVITNLSSTAPSTSNTFAGIFTSVASGTETYTNNTISYLSATSTTAISINGIYTSIASTGNRIYRNNTISNFTCAAAGTGTLYGIRVTLSGPSTEISGNTIHSFAGGSTINGINIGGGTTNNIFRNKIYGLGTTAASTAVYGIGLSGGTTNNLYNNIIGDLTVGAVSLTPTPNQIVGINATNSVTNLNLFNNTIKLAATSAGANFGSSAVSTGPTVAVTMRNNILVNSSVATGAGLSVAFRKQGLLNTYDISSNNNLFYAPVIYTDSAGFTDLTLIDFQTRLGNRDAQSVNENPNFLSAVGADPTYLHINPAVPTQIESGGANIASVTDDFDGNVRNLTTPDIGADEFAGTPLTVVAINSVGITPTGNLCTNIARTVTANVTAGGNDITSVVVKYSVNGIAQTPIAMTGGTLTAGTTSVFTATIPIVVPANGNVTWSVFATDPVVTKFITGTAYKDEPLLGLMSSVTASVNPICGTGTSVLSATLAPQATPYTASFESGITDFTGAGTGVYLVQSTSYASNGTGSMYLKALSDNSDINASSATDINLSTVPQAYLMFSHIAALEGATTANDFGYVQYSADGGATWTTFPTSSYLGTGTLFNSNVSFSTKSYANWTSALTSTGSVPNNGLWQNETIAIPTAALTSQFRIRFRYTTNGSNRYYGWLIDNVKIATGIPTAVTAYSWSDGTTEVGTGSTLSVSPTATTTYTVALTSAGCTVTSAPMTVTVAPITTPTFTQVAAICAGTTLSALPTTSDNGITGTWSPALNNTATTTYTFTPNAGQCGTTTTMTITVNPNVMPTFTQVAAICSGATLSALPTTSDNGIVGAWSPALNNTATTTYTFTPNAGQCGTTTTMTITVNPNVTPTFTQVAAICSGATLSALPTTSDNGIAGTWSPALNNTATTTYTFTPNAGQCAATATMEITVNSTPAPTGPSNQNMGNGQTMSNIAVNGSGIIWYASAADAANGVNPIAASATVNNGTYYATQTVGGCTSSSYLTVTVTVTLGVNDFALDNLKLYPNPVSSTLSIENAVEISGVEIYTITGQRVMVKTVNSVLTSVDMSELAAGTYFVKVSTEEAVKTIKIIKK